jgi:hypothetical protein
VNPVLRPAQPEDRDEIVELLHTRMNTKIPRERWALLFDYPWRPASAPDCGRVLEHEGTIVGFLGATYVDRLINGVVFRTCNMSSWYLLREYRGQGYGRAMARDLTADPDVTYTDLTATPQVHAMLLAHAGFAILDDERWLLRSSEKVKPSIAVRNSATEAPQVRDHRGFRDLRIIEIAADDGVCTLVLQVKKKQQDIAYHQVLHVDQSFVLARHAEAIAAAILPEQPAVLAIDRRLLPIAPAGGEIETIAQPRLFKSRRLHRDQIDNLYNEVLLLDQKLP